jgi:hypothetical protein
MEANGIGEEAYLSLRGRDPLAKLDGATYRRGTPCPFCGKAHNYQPCWSHTHDWQKDCGCGYCHICRCCGKAIKGTGRCKQHDGKNLQGPAHPNYKNGDFSQYGPGALMEKLPKEIRRHAEELRRRGFDPLDLLEVLYAQYGMLCDLFAQWDSCEVPPWKETAAKVNRLKRSLGRTDLSPTAREALDDLSSFVEDGAAWERIRDKLHDKIGDCMDRIVRTAAVEQDWRLKNKALVSVLVAAQLQQRIINEAARVMKDETIPRGEMVRAFVKAIDDHLIAYKMAHARQVQPGPVVDGEATGATGPPQAGEP